MKQGTCTKCGKVSKVVMHHAHGYEGENKDNVQPYCCSCHRKIHNKARMSGRCNIDPRKLNTISQNSCMKPMILGDVKRLPIKDDTYAAAYMDCPWTASWKHNVAFAMKELLRVAPVVYVLSPWTYGSHICKITSCQVAWTPGVNQALLFCRYERN